MSPSLERAITLLRTELRDGPVPAALVLSKALALGLNRDFLKVGKRQLGIVAIRDRDRQTGRTLGWRWSMPTHAPTPTPAPPSRPPLKPHRWGVYGHNKDGRYYYRQEHADTFKTLQQLIAQRQLAPPLWVLLTADAALVLPLRISADAIPALGQRWRRLEEVEAMAARKPNTRPRELSRKVSRVSSHFRR
jgi:hypothetical protein